ncbi:MAG: hypothetical protein BAA03_09640 [Caldibacillus debilis]|nr:MAG: hypothetical protein BAA03_09640 [Caldibacillus debilis]
MFLFLLHPLFFGMASSPSGKGEMIFRSRRRPDDRAGKAGKTNSILIGKSRIMKGKFFNKSRIEKREPSHRGRPARNPPLPGWMNPLGARDLPAARKIGMERARIGAPSRVPRFIGCRENR